MLGAGAASAIGFGMLLEHPSGLEIAMLRSSQPDGQGQDGSEDLS